MIAIERHPKESAAQYAVFCSHARSGPGRSLDRLAASQQLEIPRLRTWSRRFAWRLRLEQYDLALVAEQARLEQEQLKAQVVDWAARREVLKEKEYQTALTLFRLVHEQLDNPRLVWTVSDLVTLLETASTLAHRSLIGVPAPPTLQDLEAYDRQMERMRFQIQKAYPEEWRRLVESGEISSSPTR